MLAFEGFISNACLKYSIASVALSFFLKKIPYELRIKEFEFYKAVYCSLCKELGKSYGILSRFTLSYDFTFLAILNMALKDGCCEVRRKRCVFNPLKKCNFCKETDDLKMPSAAAMWWPSSAASWASCRIIWTAITMTGARESARASCGTGSIWPSTAGASIPPAYWNV